jgi:hypothetical protein
LANPWNNISRRCQKCFQNPETPPLDIAGKSLSAVRNARPLNKVLCTSLAVSDEDFGTVKKGTNRVGMYGFDDEDIDCEPANYSGRRLHPKLS